MRRSALLFPMARDRYGLSKTTEENQILFEQDGFVGPKMDVNCSNKGKTQKLAARTSLPNSVRKIPVVCFCLPKREGGRTIGGPTGRTPRKNTHTSGPLT